MISVLVVDDDFMVARVHRGFVDRVSGFEVTGLAHTGADALSAIEATRPDLVLLDVYLPDMSGLDVLRSLRERDATVDVLMVTAARDVDTVRSAMRGGVVNYLIKPFTFEALSDRLVRYAGANRNLTKAAEVDQQDVDRLFRALRPHRVELPKGLSPDTADLVARVMKDANGDLSASQCAEAVGLSRVAVRRYLEYFVDIGRAGVQPRYGTTGRPERRYRWKG